MHPVLKDLVFIAVVLAGSGGLYLGLDALFRQRHMTRRGSSGDTPRRR
ncbi:hypothetical protein [Luteimonas sp. 3794]|nr:hypothetical protein [Luteimonas sp. 3794]MDR6991685.1 hypothetical protein [Luteimonas sp. 3794]